MNWIKGLLAKFVARKAEEGLSLDNYSKAKLSAVIGVLLMATTEISKAWGHPIIIPDYVYKGLAFVGLWGIRDAIKS